MESEMTFDELKAGAVPVYEQKFGMRLSSALNPILRTYFDPDVAKKVEFPLTTQGPNEINPGERQVDHFLEIQHVAQALLATPGYSGRALCDLPVGEWLKLSRFLNTEYNLYSIPAACNNYKSRINIFKYRLRGSTEGDDDAFMRVYLDAKVGVGPTAPTVGNQIQILLKAMQNATGEYCSLTNKAGKALETILYEQDMNKLLKSGAFQAKK